MICPVKSNFKGCLAQILLGPFLNTLTHMKLKSKALPVSFDPERWLINFINDLNPFQANFSFQDPLKTSRYFSG